MSSERSPRIPLELIWQVLRNPTDRRSAARLSLVARSWTFESQAHIFHSLRLCTRRQVDHWNRAFEENPLLTAHVGSLHLSYEYESPIDEEERNDPYYYDEREPLLEEEAQRLWGKLGPYVTSISVFITPWVPEVFSDFRFIRRFKLEGSALDTIGIWNLVQAWPDLTSFRVPHYGWGSGEDLLMSMPQISPPRRLTEVGSRFVSSEADREGSRIDADYFAWLLSPSFVLDIKSAYLEWKATEDEIHFAPFCTFASAIGSTVQHLQIAFDAGKPNQGFQFLVEHECFKKYTQLESFEVANTMYWASHHHKDGHTPYLAITLASDILAQLPSRALHTVTLYITFQGTMSRLELESAANWAVADELFTAGGTFPRLRRIQFKLSREYLPTVIKRERRPKKMTVAEAEAAIVDFLPQTASRDWLYFQRSARYQMPPQTREYVRPGKVTTKEYLSRLTI